MKRTGNSKIAVVGWGRGMGHTGHMYLADAVIVQASAMKADPYFFVSKTVGKDDPLFPEEKLAIYKKVFPQYANIFTPEGNLNQALQELAGLGYKGVVLVVGADQKESFKYLEKPNKDGVPVYKSYGFDKLRVISRQETRSKYRGEAGPRATPMREILLNPDATDEQKFQVWRRDMPSALSDDEVLDLMTKAASRLATTNKPKKIKEARIIDRNAKINAYYVSPTTKQKHKVAEGIPYYLLDRLVDALTKKYAITMKDILVVPADINQYRRTSQPELAEEYPDVQSNHSSWGKEIRNYVSSVGQNNANLRKQIQKLESIVNRVKNPQKREQYLAKIEQFKNQIVSDEQLRGPARDEVYYEGISEDTNIAQPGQLVSIIQAPRMLDLLPGETFEVRTSDPEGVTLKHSLGTKYDNVKFPHGSYKIAKAQGVKEGFFGIGGPAVGAPLASTNEYNRLSGATKLRHDASVALKMVDSLKQTNHNGYYDEEIKKYLQRAQEYLAKAKEIEKQGVEEGYIFKGGFPFDVDHMPGPVIRNRDKATDIVKTKNKDKWDDEVDRINDEVFDDMSDFRTDSKGETVTGNSTVWAKWDNATQTGWINSKGQPLKPWPIKEQGVAETNVSKYKDMGATNNTTHFIKNVTTGKIVSPHRSLQDAQDALVGNERGSNDKFKIVRARKGVAEEVNPGEGYQLAAAKKYAKAAKVAKQKGDNVAYVQAMLDYHANMMTHHFLNGRDDEGEKHEAVMDRYEALLNQLDPQGVAEAYDGFGKFDAAEFQRHMDKLRAREELRKTDPMKALVGDLIDKDREKEALAKKKKPEDDSMSINDPRHPGYAYTQMGQPNIDENIDVTGNDYFAAKRAAAKAAASAEAKEYRQFGITSRKAGGDDAYSWAVFINGRMMVNGLSSREVPYYKKEALKKAKQTRGVTEAKWDCPFKKGQKILLIKQGIIAGVTGIDNQWQTISIKTQDGRGANVDKKQFGQIKAYNGPVLPSSVTTEIAELLKNGISPEEVANTMRVPVEVVAEFMPNQGGDLDESGITRRGILKGIAGAAAAGAAGNASGIAGAFPTPSHQAAMYKAAADSNAAEARRQAELQRKADATRLQQGTQDVERLNKVNYHGKNAPVQTNATWDGDSSFMDLDGTQYTMATRMPISGDVPKDMKLISTSEGRQVYIWTRYRMKGDGGHYFYPAEHPNTIPTNEDYLDE